MRLAIFISGRGSNMQALVEAARRPGYPADVALVASDRSDAPGLRIAERLGISVHIADQAALERPQIEQSLHDAARAHGGELIALAGFMRILSPDFVRRWQGRLVNIHPSLLPDFPGLHAHRRVLAAGHRVTGCTAHMVTPEVDAGTILGQARVPVLDDDDEEKLAARVLAAEHALYPRCVAELCIRLAGRDH